MDVALLFASSRRLFPAVLGEEGDNEGVQEGEVISDADDDDEGVGELFLVR